MIYFHTNEFLCFASVQNFGLFNNGFNLAMISGFLSVVELTFDKNKPKPFSDDEITRRYLLSMSSGAVNLKNQKKISKSSNKK